MRDSSFTSTIRYLEGAFVTDANRSPEEQKVTFNGRRKEYIPTAEVGARLPHMNLHILESSPDVRKDIVSLEPLIFFSFYILLFLCRRHSLLWIWCEETELSSF